MGRQRRPRPDALRRLHDDRRDVDEPRREPRRARDRLRPPRRPLPAAHRGRHGAADHERPGVRRPAALLAGRHARSRSRATARAATTSGSRTVDGDERAAGDGGGLPPRQRRRRGRPTAQYLLGRKHFTSTRSLGAGEVWLYHRSGGAGLQLTERRNDQQDQGNEIAVSPDGRYVYFSEDVHGRLVVRVQQGPQRRDLRASAGSTARRATSRRSSAGRAARRGRSRRPDGKHLAFVRRVRDEEVLFLYDIETGAETPALRRPLAATSRRRGPSSASTPASRGRPTAARSSFWAQGGLHRDRRRPSKTVTPIPFTAEVELTSTEPVTRPVRGRARAFPGADAPRRRDLARRPDVRLPRRRRPVDRRRADGTPQRIDDRQTASRTTPRSRPTAAASSTRRGATTTTAHVDVRDLDSGATRRLTERPGHYATPRFSPDGAADRVRARGAATACAARSTAPSTGLYWIDADGGPMTLVTDDGREPRFSADGERVYFLTRRRARARSTRASASTAATSARTSR